jgi:LuxR family maltose regulon positive regulatory protein
MGGGIDMKLMKIDKQTPVSLPQVCAPRAELLQIFDKAAENQFIYVHAPAGYGKTISTLLWLKKSGCKPIWISLDAYDNTTVLFYRLVCMSILSVIPNDERILQEVKSPAFNVAPVECTIDLLTRLTYEDCRYALVLDDFHLITNEEVKKSLLFVMKRLPLAITVLVLSRNNLSDPFTSLYEQQKISCIESADLAFSSHEIKKHFAGYGYFITKEEAENIHAYTEGWVIALNAIALSGNIDVSNNRKSLSFNSYMEKNIWNKLDETLREFLIKTSVPDKFSLELCEYLTESDKCMETLDLLIGGNINISFIGTEYRYHNLFLEFLHDKLKQSNMDDQMLNKRVADYYLKKGDFLTAKNYAMKSKDISTIGQTVRSFYSLKTFSLDEYIEFHKLYSLHAIPETICDKMPLLYIPRIFFSYANGDIDNVNYYFDKLYPLMPLIADTQPEVIEHVNSMILLDCRIKLSELCSHIEKLPEIVHEHKKPQSPTFTFQMPFLHRCARDFYELIDSRVHKSIKEFSSNKIKQNLELMFGGAESGLLMERNQLPEALDIALSLKNTIDESMNPEFVYAIYILIAEIYLLLNQRDKHEKIIKEVKGYIALNSCQYLTKNLSAYEARTSIMNGDKAAAEKWLKNYYINDSSFGEFYKIYRSFSTARAYILLMQTDKAYSALNKLKLLAEKYDRLLDAAEADVLLAITEWVSGKKKEAQSRLQNVLISMHQYGFIRVVANEGKAVLPILSAIIRRSEKENNQSHEIYRFTKEVYFAAYEQSKHFKGITYNSEIMVVKLSPQQKRVLEFLAKGYKNIDIVEETGLSLNTIRTHTKIAYQKLDVTNSMDAVVRAKELGIIK